MIVFNTVCEMGLRGTFLNVYRDPNKFLSKRLFSQEVTKEIKAFCYLSGNGSFFSDHVAQKEQFFIPSRKLILNKNVNYSATKPDNAITVRMNEMETFDVETPLVPVNLDVDALDKFLKLGKQCRNIDKEIGVLQERKGEVRREIEKIFLNLLSKVDKNALSYK